MPTDDTKSTKFCFCHQMNQITLIFFFCQRITRRARIYFFLLSPDEPDEPDGWRNVMSGSSGSSGDYKTTYFTKDNLCNLCNLLTKNFVVFVLSVGNKKNLLAQKIFELSVLSVGKNNFRWQENNLCNLCNLLTPLSNQVRPFSPSFLIFVL